MRKRTVKSLKKEADVLWSKAIRLKARCERCQRNDVRLEAAHIYSRGNTATRHDLENGLCLCTGCHFWAHHNPIDFVKWVEVYKGKELVEGLMLRSKKPVMDKMDAVYTQRIASLKEYLGAVS